MCGIAAKEKRVMRVHDVREFEGYIACDAGSRSEIVSPILVRGEVDGSWGIGGRQRADVLVRLLRLFMSIVRL